MRLKKQNIIQRLERAQDKVIERLIKFDFADDFFNKHKIQFIEKEHIKEEYDLILDEIKDELISQKFINYDYDYKEFNYHRTRNDDYYYEMCFSMSFVETDNYFLFQYATRDENIKEYVREYIEANIYMTFFDSREIIEDYEINKQDIISCDLLEIFEKNKIVFDSFILLDQYNFEEFYSALKIDDLLNEKQIADLNILIKQKKLDINKDLFLIEVKREIYIQDFSNLKYEYSDIDDIEEAGLFDEVYDKQLNLLSNENVFEVCKKLINK